MESVFIKLAVGLAISLTSILYTHFLASKKEYDRRSEELRDRIIMLEQTSVKEHNVKQLINDQISPLTSGIDEVKSMLKSMLGDVQKIQLELAEKKGAEKALQELHLHRRADDGIVGK